MDRSTDKFIWQAFAASGNLANVMQEFTAYLGFKYKYKLYVYWLLFWQNESKIISDFK
jgi:hypothetical protein